MARDAAQQQELFERHVSYEIWMLIETHARLSGGIDDLVTRNAFIESFCVHARQLIDFFNGKGGASASSFTLPTYLPFPTGPIAQLLVTKLNTQIVHITYERTSDPTRKIDHDARERLMLGLVAEIANFYQHLKPEYRLSWPKNTPPNSVMKVSPGRPQATSVITTTST